LDLEVSQLESEQVQL
jgi:DNA repair protein RAD50